MEKISELLGNLNWLTIAVLIFMIFFAVRGPKRGFLLTLFGVVSLVVALLGSHLISPVITNWVLESEKVVAFYTDKVEEDVDLENETAKEEQAASVAELSLPEALKNAILQDNSKSAYSELGVENFKNYVIYRIAAMMIRAVVYVVTFVILFVAVALIIRAMDLIAKLPVLKGANQAAGLLLGVAEGFLLLWIGCIVLTMFASKEWAGKAFEMIEQSVILSKIYNNNLLLTAITILF